MFVKYNIKVKMKIQNEVITEEEEKLFMIGNRKYFEFGFNLFNRALDLYEPFDRFHEVGKAGTCKEMVLK